MIITALYVVAGLLGVIFLTLFAIVITTWIVSKIDVG